MIVVKIEDKEVRDFLKRLPKEAKKRISNGIKNWGVNLQKSMKLAIAHRRFTGQIEESIEWRHNRNIDGSGLWIKQEGIALDRTITHKVSLNKSAARNIRMAEWAIAHGKASERGNKVYPKYITVRKHPFIERTFNRHIPKLDNFLQREMNKIK